MKILSLINQKGGVAKTTSAINLASALTKLEKKVLLLDIDPQGNATSGSGINKRELINSTNELLLEGVNVGDCILSSSEYDVIGTNLNLASAEVKLFSMLARENALKNKLEDLGGYDYVIIDCPPSLSLLTINALVASTDVFIPVSTEPFALEGIEQLLQTVNSIKSINKSLSLSGVFVTKFDTREKMSHDTYNGLNQVFGLKLMKTKIRIAADVKKGQGEGKNIFQYNSKSNAAKDYMALAREVVGLE